jgi:hypothetical protein
MNRFTAIRLALRSKNLIGDSATKNALATTRVVCDILFQRQQLATKDRR